jgi:hypothetical protein
MAPAGPIGLVEPGRRAGADGTRNGDARLARPAGTAIGTIAREFRGTPSPRLTIQLRSDHTHAPLSAVDTGPMAAGSAPMLPHVPRR